MLVVVEQTCRRSVDSGYRGLWWAGTRARDLYSPNMQTSYRWTASRISREASYAMAAITSSSRPMRSALQYQAAPGAPLAAARVPRRPWTAPTTIPGAVRG